MRIKGIFFQAKSSIYKSYSFYTATNLDFDERSFRMCITKKMRVFCRQKKSEDYVKIKKIKNKKLGNAFVEMSKQLGKIRISVTIEGEIGREGGLVLKRKAMIDFLIIQ